jgi:hypothetical protein
VAIPLTILIVCFGLFVLFAVVLTRMLAETARATRSMRTLARSLKGVPVTARHDRRAGLGDIEIGALRHAGGSLGDPMKSWWARVEDHLERYVTPEGRSGWFLVAPARAVLPEEVVTDRLYHAAFYQVIPGVLTGLGLLATFVAILLALTALHVTAENGTESVLGIKELIEGLSGKFLSSIVGLLLSLTFLLIERRWSERRVTLAYEALLDTISELLPTITATRAQLDLQALARQQTMLLQALGEDVAHLRDVRSMADSRTADLALALAGDVERLSDRLGALSARLGVVLHER